MKKIPSICLLVSIVCMFSQCDKVNYRKMKSGLLYKIYPGKGTDSLIKERNVVKFEITTRFNDSMMYSSYGKMAAFARLMPSSSDYNLLAIMPMLRKGDSAVIVQMADTLMKIGAPVPPNARKGDRITTTMRIVEVYRVDSLAIAEYNKEMAKDRPRQIKEQEEMRRTQEAKIDEELKKSGEIPREMKELETYFVEKKIDAKKIGRGTYIVIHEPGTGPNAVPGKFVSVKYTGKILTTDSTFEASTYEFPLGQGRVIAGWDEGIQELNKGCKATLFVPGFLAYGPNPEPHSPFRPFEALKFDVELLNISDTPTVKRQMR